MSIEKLTRTPTLCEDCGEVTTYNADTCESCCDHSDTDNHCCLICNKEMTETWACAAYDRAKDARKYGDC